MASTLSQNKLPFTSHSLTSIKYPQSNKIDKIIVKLQKRKQQLIEILSQNIRLDNQQTSKSNPPQLKSITQNNSQNNKQLKNIQKLIQRKQKYTTKIEKQRIQHTNIQQQIKQLNNKIIECVIYLQQNQIQLKNISQSVAQNYRYCFGIKQENYLSNKKWILFRILELESLLQNSQLNMRIMLCQFYREQNKILKYGDDAWLPSCWLVQYIVKFKLVNKLYGRILQNKKYRVQYSNYKRVKQQSQQQIQQQQIQSSKQSEDQSELQRQKLHDNKNKDTNKYHDLWLQILKLMKILQKLEPASTKIQEIQTFTKSGININQLQVSIIQKIKQTKIIKRTWKLLSEQIKISKTKIQQLTQQLKIKQQLISNIKQKIKQLDKQIIEQTKIYQNNKKNQYNITLQKKQLFQDQFKEIEQAIKYFIIKKNTHSQNYQNNNVDSFMHFKSIEDNTTFYMSPQKATVNNARFVSPDMFSTNKKTNKYSLKYLLSPQKQLAMQNKKKAWK